MPKTKAKPRKEIRTVLIVPHGYRWTNSNIIRLAEIQNRINDLAAKGASSTTLEDLWTFREIIEALMYMDITPTRTGYIAEEQKE